MIFFSISKTAISRLDAGTRGWGLEARGLELETRNSKLGTRNLILDIGWNPAECGGAGKIGSSTIQAVLRGTDRPINSATPNIDQAVYHA